MSQSPERWIHAAASCSDRDWIVICSRDKSLTHRALMFAALARGFSRIHDPLAGADCLSTMDCFRALGVRIEPLSDRSWGVISRGYRAFAEPDRDLDCGNSGTTARLMTGILAACEGLQTRLVGDASLSQRPMRRVVEPLKKMGAAIEGREGANFLPLTIQGRRLQALSHRVDQASAQVKSALLFAGLFCEGETRITLPEGSRDHTERMLLRMGARLQLTHREGLEHISLQGPFEPLAGEFRIPVDPSSAAFFAVLGLLRPRGSITLPQVLNNPTRLGFLRILQRMSGALETAIEEKSQFVESSLRIRVRGGMQLHPASINAADVPTLVDEIPILAVAAAFASGPSRFSGLEELRVKESDRLSKTAELLSLAGAGVTIQGDDLLIAGGLREVKSFRYDSLGDHRLAMAAAVLARLAEKPCCILDAECVRVSFPDFYEVLESVS